MENGEIVVNVKLQIRDLFQLKCDQYYRSFSEKVSITMDNYFLCYTFDSFKKKYISLS
jgi:hypothetical protein